MFEEVDNRQEIYFILLYILSLNDCYGILSALPSIFLYDVHHDVPFQPQLHPTLFDACSLIGLTHQCLQ